MVELQPSKLIARVRFPPPAYSKKKTTLGWSFSLYRQGSYPETPVGQFNSIFMNPIIAIMCDYIKKETLTIAQKLSL